MPSLLEIIKQDVVELSSTVGLLLKQKRDNQDPAYVHLPLSMFPMPYPLESFIEACDLQLPFGRILAGLVREPQTNLYDVVI